jgi:HlyD family secretion protein
MLGFAVPSGRRRDWEGRELNSVAGRIRSGASASRALTAIVVVVALVIVGLVLRGFMTSAPIVPPTLRTAVVTRDTVRTVASETGTLVPVQQQNVNFRQAGQLTDVAVKVGDKVKAGQVLAKIDDRALQNALAQAQKRQQSDQSNLNATLTGNAVQTAQHQVDAARIALANTQRQADLTNQQDAVTVAQDQAFVARDAQVLAKDQGALNHDTSLFDHDRSLLDSDTNQLQKDQAIVAGDQAQVAKDEGRVAVDQTRLQQDQGKVQADCPPTIPGPPSATCTADQNAVKNDQDRLNSDQKQLASDQKQLALDQAPLAQDQAQVQIDTTALNVDSGQMSQDRGLVAQDGTKVEQDQSVLRADLQKQAADRVAGERAVNDAQAALQSAEDALAAQTSLRPNTIAGQQAVVASDAAAVDSAKQSVEEATLVAPVAGTVASINGAPGEPVNVGQDQTPQAPGSQAPLPDVSASSPLNPASLSTGGGPAIQAFMVLSDVHSFQVVATVAEADAGRVNPGQQVKVSFDAVPGLSLPGSVVAMQPVATLIQDITNYLVTVNLDTLDPRLRSGMTAHASIAVGEARDVLAVPNIAIQHSGPAAYVTVVGRDGTQHRVEIKTGVVGDSTTEVVSGLSEGDHVLLPAVTPPGASNQPLS